MARLNPSSINTIRMITFLTHPHSIKTDVEPVLLDFAGVRAGRAGSCSDNLSNGGFMIEVDHEAGYLKRGRYAPEHGGAFVDEHPDSKFPFVGFQIPYWEEAIELCFRTAMALPSVRSVGWDVAITDDGPLIIEGNCPWAPRLPQGYGTGFLNPERRARLEDAGATLPAPHLPP
ncbi:hypothetical protein ROA7450_02636 [Roseovarius albus]|uniref:Alpha-L-glutamate ligase-related protein ATP-grasp domain-containing protein n=2 Tax=Roseovarius albus TaxID=1247867 RepID=A0A1X6ZI88_9RHOB|nr:hypothetical protein ROA7450_02636 [Roseovarius albus]